MAIIDSGCLARYLKPSQHEWEDRWIAKRPEPVSREERPHLWLVIRCQRRKIRLRLEEARLEDQPKTGDRDTGKNDCCAKRPIEAPTHDGFDGLDQSSHSPTTTVSLRSSGTSGSLPF